MPSAVDPDVFRMNNNLCLYAVLSCNVQMNHHGQAAAQSTYRYLPSSDPASELYRIPIIGNQQSAHRTARVV